ncbi:DnaJ-like molecular chaperone [Theileria orientalis strain Shintoku]|uniref:DnaJ-like molecular chaperone n=1 Tax=Theileria orientalis strain Shintoku TaxID=869250 RepID=J4CCK6_THEOR|nr:DnaJ-like molecular chaperone [Theileria orientalis strain Shintoku]PVC49550.1 DnaJ-like molecular chaperone [Theileria orientalis]BAM39557.1 DnaJ-like molecular chaperone [Theileria orientalis strain Shintoku]|eukprot:XP_009689858.1 DnaJ-like molecular chaperone [Theileria orientalis strain Shintoku]
MGLNGLLGHSVVAALANSLLLVGENMVTKKVNSFFRCSLHVLIASVLFLCELPKFKDTYFAYLGLPITATHSEVLKSYDTIQEQLKNGAPKVVAMIKRAYEVLSNQETRILYSLYGDVAIAAKTPQDFTIILITVSFSYYALSTIVCCVFNRSNRLRFARYVCVLYNAIAFFLEVEMRFFYASIMTHVFYLKTLLPYQHIEFLRAIPPFVMMAASLFTHFFTVDYDKLNLFLWQSTVATNTAIIEKMSKVVNATEYLKNVGTDDINVSKDLSDSAEKDGTLGDMLNSLDEDKKKRLMDLLSSESGKKKNRVLDMLKVGVIYFVMFISMKVFFK